MTLKTFIIRTPVHHWFIAACECGWRGHYHHRFDTAQTEKRHHQEDGCNDE